MREHDLQAAPAPRKEVDCDVCIVGAGAAGLYLATRLSDIGRSVVVLEGGGRVCREAGEVGLLPIFAGEPYPGAVEGRAFGLGGTTSRWGGLLVPHSRHDVRGAGAGQFDPWAEIVSKVEARTGAVLSRLGVASAGFAEPELGAALGTLKAGGFDAVAAQFLPFSARNLAHLVAGRKASRSGIQLFLNAFAATWRTGGGGQGRSRIHTVGAVSTVGNTVAVRAKHVVIAAGAIESARVLLEIQRAEPRSPFGEGVEVGKNLSDHLSCRIADVRVEDRGQTARIFGPRFGRRGMRSFRFIELDRPADAPRGFAHFIFDIDNPGFHVAKEGIAALQARRFPRLTASEVISGGRGLAALAFDRYARARLHIPESTAVHLQLDVEQLPSVGNAVSLSEELDRYGRPVARINWRITESDHRNVAETARRILGKWPGSRAGLPDLIPTSVGGSGPKPHDAYHPVGTCRLGADKCAVVDRDLRVNGTENLWVLSTAVLPSAGTANPTFTMLCLGDDLADKLHAELDHAS